MSEKGRVASFFKLPSNFLVPEGWRGHAERNFVKRMKQKLYLIRKKAPKFLFSINTHSESTIPLLNFFYCWMGTRITCTGPVLYMYCTVLRGPIQYCNPSENCWLHAIILNGLVHEWLFLLIYSTQLWASSKWKQELSQSKNCLHFIDYQMILFLDCRASGLIKLLYLQTFPWYCPFIMI